MTHRQKKRTHEYIQLQCQHKQLPASNCQFLWFDQDQGVTYQCRDDEILGGSGLHPSQMQCIKPQHCGDRSNTTQNRHRNDWVPSQRSIQCICDGHDEVQPRPGSLVCDARRQMNNRPANFEQFRGLLIYYVKINLATDSYSEPHMARKGAFAMKRSAARTTFFGILRFGHPPCYRWRPPSEISCEISWPAFLHGMAVKLGMTGSPATVRVEVPHCSEIRQLHETPFGPLMLMSAFGNGFVRPRPDQAPLISPSLPTQEQATKLPEMK